MRAEVHAPPLLIARITRCPLPSTYAFAVLVEKAVGQLAGLFCVPGGPQYVSTSLLPNPLFPKSKLHTVMSGGPGTVALNSWHHCAVHVTVPAVLTGTPAQPCAPARAAPASDRITTASSPANRHSQRFLRQLIVSVLFFRRKLNSRKRK